MKNILKLCLPLLAACAAGAASPVAAQGNAGDILTAVEKNNTTLQALRKRVEAQQYACKSERALDAPEVGFDYLWGSPADIGTRKDITVTQSIDLAALTGARGKLAGAKSELYDIQYRVERQNVLLEAERLYINIVYCNALAVELSSRLERSAEMEAACREMQVRGETDMIEVNKAHIAYLSQKNALARNDVERESLLSELRRLNGGEPIEVNDSAYPAGEMLPSDFRSWYEDTSLRSPELAYMRKNVEVNAAESRAVKMSNWPKLSAGYMAELVKGSNFRGLTLGLSVPLWSVRSKVRQADSSYEASKLEERDASVGVYESLRGQYEKAKGLQDIVSELSSSLAVSSETAALVEQRLDSGDISIIDSLMELTLYYSLKDEAMAADRDFRLALADLRMWEL